MLDTAENNRSSETSADGSGAALGERRWAVLAILFLVYLTSSMDRMIVSIIGEPIKNELRLADWQLGLLSGFAFSLLYIGLGVPLARLADRRKRVTIITVCLTVWSAATALCGLATSFAQLVLFRMGVGVGEAGCLPTSHSLISDYFPSSQRTTALALFGVGLPLGGLGGMIIGGAIADWFGWREAFLILGLPGLALAVLVKTVVREPPRRADDAASASSHDTGQDESLGQVLSFLARSPAARNVLIAVTLATMFTSPTVTFLAPFMVRGFSLSYTEIGLMLGLAQMGGMALSTFLGGILSDWFGKSDRRWYMWIPAISLILGGPLFATAFMQTTWPSFVLLLFLAALTGAAYLPPSYAVLYSLVKPRWRATTAATTGVLMNLIGLSIGPLLCGFLIDHLTTRNLTRSGHSELVEACIHGGAAAMTDASLATICNAANLDATRFSLIVFSLGVLWPAAHFFRAAQKLNESRTRAV
jgi:MFS family permease